jgi:hypothetical protein
MSMISKLRAKLRLRTRVRRVLKISAPDSGAGQPQAAPSEVRVKVTKRPREHTVLIISHKERQCGIYQYGLNITEALEHSSRYSFAYAECSSGEEVDQAVAQAHPSVIIYNYYPMTMPWLTSQITRRYKVPQIGIEHEATQEEADKATTEMFDFHLCIDPTLIERNPIVFSGKRLIPPYDGSVTAPDVLTVGSFGFGFDDKGFERLIETVQNEFDRARIVIHMPFNDIVDKEGAVYALATAERCRGVVSKPGIELVITHDFLSKQQLLDFLAGNTLNAFFYNTDKHRGISSCIEHALAVRRPLAITKCGMFRHVLSAEPSICIEDSSLAQIIENGIAPLTPFYEEWSTPSFVSDYERILDRVLGKESAPGGDTVGPAPRAQMPEVGLPDVTSFNRILDNRARVQYRPVIEKLFELQPEMMQRKIVEANVQQAFVMDTVQKFASRHAAPKILCVGSYEDTAAAGLKSLGYEIEEIDPVLNWDLDTFFHQPSTVKGSYDIIFSTSVLEHVRDDELFMSQIAELLAPGGTAVLTCDYNDQYEPGDAIPTEDFRLYTQKDLKGRILPLLKDCSLVDEPQWDCPTPDFTYKGVYRYTFATLVFQKKR